MEKEKDYSRDITEIRSMMERSTRFMSLSGLSGVLAGIYALVGAFVAYRYFYPENAYMINNIPETQGISFDVSNLIILALIILVLAVGTAVILSLKKSRTDGVGIWNSTARRMVINMAIPLVTGGVFILILLSRGMIGFIAPATLIFYGLALVNASKFTLEEIRSLGIVQIIIGLLAFYYVEYALILWALGFGVMHVVYGILMHVKYEK